MSLSVLGADESFSWKSVPNLVLLSVDEAECTSPLAGRVHLVAIPVACISTAFCSVLLPPTRPKALLDYVVCIPSAS